MEPVKDQVGEYVRTLIDGRIGGQVEDQVWNQPLFYIEYDIWKQIDNQIEEEL